MLSRSCRCLYRFANSTNSLRVLSTGYKSKISLDNIYPDSVADYSSTPFQPKAKVTGTTDREQFTGYIPLEKLDINFSRGSGPGGQNVNKVNTKVEIRCHVSSADWIPEWIRPRVLEQQKSKVTKDGVLIVTSDKTRKQLMNQADCLDKLRTMVRRAAYEPAPTSEEDVKLREKRLEKRKKQILTEKRQHSLKKASRSAPGF